jgi:hypothetical protein
MEERPELSQPQVEPGLALRRVHAAFVLEHVHRNLPPVGLAADHAIDRYAYLVEEGLAHFLDTAGEGQGATGQTGRAGVHQQRGQPAMAAVRGTRAHQSEEPCRPVSVAGPHLLTLDHDVVPFESSPGAQRCQIAAGVGLREGLRPHLLPAKSRGK